jgi:hypothetical protein
MLHLSYSCIVLFLLYTPSCIKFIAYDDDHGNVFVCLILNLLQLSVQCGVVGFCNHQMVTFNLHS